MHLERTCHPIACLDGRINLNAGDIGKTSEHTLSQVETPVAPLLDLLSLSLEHLGTLGTLKNTAGESRVSRSQTQGVSK